MTSTTDLFGNIHEIKKCTLEDISEHFSLIAHYIPENEHQDFQKRMADSVFDSTAFAISDNSCFLYYQNYSKGCANGWALYGKNSPIKLLALFAGVFSKLDKNTFKIDFRLHPGKTLAEYRSILTSTSIERYHSLNSPLVIRVDELRNKLDKLRKARGVVWEM